MFHWAATDGDTAAPDGHRRLERFDVPQGVSITNHYRDRIIRDAGITRRWWNNVVTKWVEAGIACRCEGYEGVFLFIFKDSACRRCGSVAGTQRSQDREPRVPVPGSEGSRFQRGSQSANGVQGQSALGVEGLEGSEGSEPQVPALQKSRGRDRVNSADEAWEALTGVEDDAANL